MLLWTGGQVLVLLIKLRSSLAQEVACPCVTQSWKYNGDSFSYCANPTGLKTDWCPTEVSDDGSYDSKMGFAWCTPGPVYEACKTAKAANIKPCPCASSWKFRGEEYSFCADTGIGFDWCATETDAKGNYIDGKYAKCTTDVREQCEEAAEEEEAAIAADTSGCPCISGGQWTFEGERQSYCQQPNGLGKRPWCPTNEAVMTTSDFGKVDFAYCTNKIMKKCQILEGTREPTQCPCVDSKWKYKKKTYSYCEKTNFCPTEVDDKLRPVGAFAKCKNKAVRNACGALHQLTETDGAEKMYGEYTQANTGCVCWFDMSRSDCACCEDDGVQCGAPMQQWCTSKTEGRESGCLGVPANHWTLSNTGYPCYWNTTRTDCAWCAPGGAQCGPEGSTGPDSAQGSRCWKSGDTDYCDSVPGNCLHINKCDEEAECVFDVKFGDREHHQCSCKPGWTGNGIQCYDNEGNPSEPQTSTGDVRMTLAVTNDYYVYPHNSAEFPLGPGETNLLDNITALFDAGASCADGNACNGTFANLEETP